EFPDSEEFDEGDIAVEPDEARRIRLDLQFELSRLSELLLRDGQAAAAETADAVVDLLDEPASPWEQDHYMFWKAVGRKLEVNDDTLAQRKRRFFQQLLNRREEVSEFLRSRILRMLAQGAAAAIEDCNRALVAAAPSDRNTIEFLRDFWLWWL